MVSIRMFRLSLDHIKKKFNFAIEIRYRGHKCQTKLVFFFFFLNFQFKLIILCKFILLAGNLRFFNFSFQQFTSFLANKIFNWTIFALDSGVVLKKKIYFTDI